MQKSDFFGMLFHVRDYLHLRHLETTSYPTHLALQEAYEKILILSDTLIEGTIGIEGYFDITIPSTGLLVGSVEFMEKFYEYLKINRKLFKENWQLAVMDQIEEVVAKTLYKIKYLK